MSFIGNIFWLILGGIVMSVLWMVSGLLLCVTVIGIPFGMQCYKIAGFVIWPFGREIDPGNFGVGGLLMNVIWLILFGWEFAVSHLVFGLLLCITIIGIPFGLQHIKLANLGLIPFGAKIHPV